jgi:hypothetical protein
MAEEGKNQPGGSEATVGNKSSRQVPGVSSGAANSPKTPTDQPHPQGQDPNLASMQPDQEAKGAKKDVNEGLRPTTPGQPPQYAPSSQNNQDVTGNRNAPGNQSELTAMSKRNETNPGVGSGAQRSPPQQQKKPLDHDVKGVDKIKALVDVLPEDPPGDHV